jgi:hypothetical protein
MLKMNTCNKVVYTLLYAKWCAKENCWEALFKRIWNVLWSDIHYTVLKLFTKVFNLTCLLIKQPFNVQIPNKLSLWNGQKIYRHKIWVVNPCFRSSSSTRFADSWRIDSVVVEWLSSSQSFTSHLHLQRLFQPRKSTHLHSREY